METKITSLKDIQELPVMVRVISNTTNPDNISMNNMIGGEFEVRSTHNNDNSMGVYDTDRLDCWYFHNSDLQILTPIKYNGVTIGIGDEVKWSGDWCEVYNSYWFDGEFFLHVAKYKNYSNCWNLNKGNITDHRPLHPTTQNCDLTDDQLIAELKKRGRVTEGNIISNHN